MYTCKQNKHSLLLEDAGEPICCSEKLEGEKKKTSVYPFSPPYQLNFRVTKQFFIGEF